MDKSKNNEYLKTMQPIFYLMKTISALPIRIKPQNGIPHSITTIPVTCLVITMYISAHIHFLNYLITGVLMDENITSIVTLVSKGPEILYGLFCLGAPLLMWGRKKEIQNYWDTWKSFQLKYEAVNGAPYVSKKRRYIKITAYVCITWIIVRSLYAALFHYHIFFGIIDFIFTAYIHFEAYVISLYWFSNCAYFQSTSEDILILGKKVIAGKKESYKLNQIIVLWSNLKDLTEQFNEAHSFLFLTFLVLIFIELITVLHALLNYSAYKIIYPITYFCNLSFLYVALLLIICGTAYSVHHQIYRCQKEALLLENTMEIDSTALKSVLRFLQTISIRNSAMNLNGFIRLSRMEFPMILSLGIYYLIVLRQFSEG